MIPAHLAALIPGCEEGVAPRLVQPLPGGRGCNLVLRVDTDAGRFVFRQRKPPLDRPGSPAMTELRCHMIAAAAGLAPRIIQAAMDGSWLLMDFIDAAPWTDEQLLSKNGVERLGLRLAQLHGLAAPQVELFDAPAIALGYLQQLDALRPALAGQYRQLLQQVQQLTRTINGLAARTVLNHGDLQPANMLGAEPLLIDWEYAQLVDPTYDIACLLTYYPALESQLVRLMASAGLANPADEAVLALQRERFACLNRLWEAANVTELA